MAQRAPLPQTITAQQDPQPPTLDYAFIGGGTMGQALAAGLLRQGARPDSLLACEPRPQARKSLDGLGIPTAAQAGASLARARLVVLAVKPQDARAVCEALSPLLAPGQPVLSILAGVRTESLARMLGPRPLVRTMPNTPAQIGQGMSVYYAAALDGPTHALVQRLLDASGAHLRVEREAQLDAATAICGCGPAYAFFLAEHWIEAAKELGFSADEAETLVRQTLLGAARLWEARQAPAATLRQQVTSKGGATEAALQCFAQHGLPDTLRKGIRQAFARTQELGKA